MKIQKGLVDPFGFPSSDKDGATVDGGFFSSSEIIHEKSRLQSIEDKKMWPNLQWWQVRPWIKFTFGNLLKP
jgi:hypothetical protein